MIMSDQTNSETPALNPELLASTNLDVSSISNGAIDANSIMRNITESTLASIQTFETTYSHSHNAQAHMLQEQSRAPLQPWLAETLNRIHHTDRFIQVELGPNSGQTEFERVKWAYATILKNIINEDAQKEEHYNSERPKDYCCPITQTLMSEPVQTPSGHHFEWAAMGT